MGKKSKSKKKMGVKGFSKSRYDAYDDDYRRNKKGKKKKSSREKLSVGKDDVKTARKAMMKPPKVPKELLEIREKCNHHCDALTLQQYEGRGFGRLNIPNIDAFVERFGSDSVRVCEVCGEVFVQKPPSPATVSGALVTLRASINLLLKSSVTKNKEIRKLVAIRDILTDEFGDFLAEYSEEFDNIRNMAKAELEHGGDDSTDSDPATQKTPGNSQNVSYV